MKINFITLFFLALTTLGWSACLDDDDDDLVGNWVRRSDFEGTPRSNAVAFSIGPYAYVGLGYDGDEDLSDFWRYDPALDFWTAVDSFPGPARRAAVAFSLDGIGYVGSGYNGDLEKEFLDFYAFDPTAPRGSQWRRVADFPGSARYNAVAFADSENGYVGAGFDDNSWLKDFYAYSPTGNRWEQVVSLGGSKRESAASFSVNDLHFVGTGRNNGAYESDFWAYDATTGSWERLTDLDEDDNFAIIRHASVGFSINGRGYFATGVNGANLSTIWEYDPSLDEWEEKNDFEGTSRSEAVAFVIDGRAFITTGRGNTTRFDDLWEFEPDVELDEDD